MPRPGRHKGGAAGLILGLIISTSSGQARAFSGRIVDAASGRPLVGALIVSNAASARSADDGRFEIATDGSIRIKALGYCRRQVEVGAADPPTDIKLAAVTPRAVFLSMGAIDRPALQAAIWSLHDRAALNALVIDVKNTDGDTSVAGSLRDDLQDAARLKARSTAVAALLERMHAAGLYAIARIAVFEDDRLVRADRGEALIRRDGRLVEDTDGRAWADARNETVRAYDISVAVAAARAGFDEIQFDYIRFPTVRGAPSFSMTSDQRRAVIRGFLHDAGAALAPYNVFVSADLFGYTSWDPSDLKIGQTLGDAAGEVDYISLMLYPSAFKDGIPGVRTSLDQPGAVVGQSLARAARGAHLDALRFRPWLQAFGAGDSLLAKSKIAAQIDSADAFGSDGWMLWHPLSHYAAEDIPGPPGTSGCAAQ
jgi:hypothetical protein